MVLKINFLIESFELVMKIDWVALEMCVDYRLEQVTQCIEDHV